MSAQQTGAERANSKTIERWSAYLEELHARIAHRFLRPEVRARAYRYLSGLLGEVGRKNSWQMAEAIGEARPRGVQHLLNDARWDPDLVREDLREYVVEHLGDEQSGVLVVDETGFLKKGEKSVGVARQYTGTAGKRENCQVGVFLCYASSKGAAFVDRELYLPEEWAYDPERREEAGVPERVRFATKGELAKAMLRRAFEAGMPARWVVADTVYGTARGLRGCIEERDCYYVLAVPETRGVYHEGCQRQARTLAKSLPQEAWFRASAGSGSKGDRLYDWACLTLPDTETAGAGRWLLMRRGIDDPTEHAYYLAYGPKETPVHELIRVAGRRWAIEDSFEAAKGEVGLDDYEVRKWDGWHRHTTLCLLAHAYLAVVRSVAEHEEGAGKGGSLSRENLYPELIPPTVPEVRRVILAMTKSEEEREFRLGWSLWRRAHQAVAKRCHVVSHAAKHGPFPEEERLPDLVPPAPATTPFSTPIAACLSDEKWKLVKPLMPVQKPPTGRLRSDHRTVLSGMLWVIGTGASWRDLPEEKFGPWRTVYGRYRQWREQGLWQRIVQMLKL